MGIKAPMVIFKKHLAVVTVSVAVFVVYGTVQVFKLIKPFKLTQTELAIQALKTGESRQIVIEKLNKAFVDEATNTNSLGAENILGVIRDLNTGKPRGELVTRLHRTTELRREIEIRSVIEQAAIDAAEHHKLLDLCQVVVLCEVRQRWQHALRLLDTVQLCNAGCSKTKTELELKEANAKARLELLSKDSKFWSHISTGVSIAECIKTQSICDCIGPVAKAHCGDPRRQQLQAINITRKKL